MDIRQTHREIELFLDKVDSQALPDILPQEKDIIYHEAELRLVNQTYGGNNIYKKGFQENQKRTDDLNSLVKIGYIASEPVDLNTVKFNLRAIYPNANLTGTPSSDYLYFLGAMVNVTSPRANGRTQPFLCSIDDLGKVLSDPYNKPTIARPILSFANGYIYGHIDNTFNITSLEIKYIKYPRKVSYKDNISSELPEHKQREAIQLAVRIALGMVESPRVEEQSAQLGTLE
jgi:hypothetical protein